LVPADITHVLTATCTPEYLCPSTACTISANLGIQGPMAFDLNAACSGFVYGMELAKGILAGSPQARVLLVSTEALTRRVDWTNRSTSVLFGDGAGAAVLTSGAATGGTCPACVEDVLCRADGTQASLLTVGGGTHTRYEPADPVGSTFYIDMQGRDVFKHAVRRLTSISQEILERNKLHLSDVDLFIPHQANLRIIEAVGDRLDLHGDRVFINVHEYGNTSAASIPLALEDARRQGVIKPGMRVLLATFGGGFTWGAALLRF
ncbi:MAG: beta-ketoacyl-ACP synthase 3, partial [Bilophila sp.]